MNLGPSLRLALTLPRVMRAVPIARTIRQVATAVEVVPGRTMTTTAAVVAAAVVKVQGTARRRGKRRRETQRFVVFCLVEGRHAAIQQSSLFPPTEDDVDN